MKQECFFACSIGVAFPPCLDPCRRRCGRVHSDVFRAFLYQQQAHMVRVPCVFLKCSLFARVPSVLQPLRLRSFLLAHLPPGLATFSRLRRGGGGSGNLPWRVRALAVAGARRRPPDSAIVRRRNEAAPSWPRRTYQVATKRHQKLSAPMDKRRSAERPESDRPAARWARQRASCLSK